jgi:hypothetical protein
LPHMVRAPVVDSVIGSILGGVLPHPRKLEDGPLSISAGRFSFVRRTTAAANEKAPPLLTGLFAHYTLEEVS